MAKEINSDGVDTVQQFLALNCRVQFTNEDQFVDLQKKLMSLGFKWQWSRSLDGESLRPYTFAKASALRVSSATGAIYWAPSMSTPNRMSFDEFERFYGRWVEKNGVRGTKGPVGPIGIGRPTPNEFRNGRHQYCINFSNYGDAATIQRILIDELGVEWANDGRTIRVSKGRGVGAITIISGIMYWADVHEINDSKIQWSLWDLKNYVAYLRGIRLHEVMMDPIQANGRMYRSGVSDKLWETFRMRNRDYSADPAILLLK